MRIVVSAGPTREHLDPVRFLSNPSTGKMGFAIAAEAARRGHDVTLVSGPVTLGTPRGVKRTDVVSAREMLEKCIESLDRSGGSEGASGRVAFIATAAVADWRPARCATKKLKKGQMSSTLKLVRNPDILKTVSRNFRKALRTAGSPRRLSLVGFAAETNDVLKEAVRKCREKGLSFIVANDVTKRGCGFGTDTNQVTFVFPDGRTREFPLMSKRRVAINILKEIENES